MLVFFYILFALLVTGATVYGLHRYQAMEVEYTVDRTMPLPPLEEGFRAEASPEIKGTTDEESAPKAQVAAQSKKTASAKLPQDKSPQIAPEAKTVGWQTQVNRAKKSGNLDLAYQICVDNYPLWGAYNQACIILRSRLKSLQLSRAESETLLRELYRCAVVAELLHDKSEGAEHYTLSQLKAMPLEGLLEKGFDYTEIGYAQLRLIRKSDVKLLQNHWGRPKTHQLPRKAQAQLWQFLTENLPA